jgi:AcrR family transcriptional regulator
MPRIVDHGAQRAEILGRSLQLFASRGTAALSMRELADALGFSTGTLYHYFSGKEELFAQLVADVLERTLRGLDEAVRRGKGRRARVAALAAFVEERRDELGQALLVALDGRRQGGESAERVAEAAAALRGRLGELLDLRDERSRDAVFAAVLGGLAGTALLGEGPPPETLRLSVERILT